MASSVFLTPGGTASSPIAFPDGLTSAPAITWANNLTSGWYRAGTNDFRYVVSGTEVVQITQTNLNMIAPSGLIQVPSGGSFTFATTGFITATGTTGLFQFRNIAATAGVSLNVNTDGVMILRDRTNAAFGTLDCLGLKASGVAGANFGPSAVASLTIVNGIVTAAS